MFDPNVKRVFANLGWEQEYFLVDTALYNARPDLCLTGRTLMGHSSAKDQQLDDHYFGSIPPRVTSFMKELELECHKLGIPVKTRHNEVAPNQFELAPIFEDVNLANDHNQLVMDLMKRIASKHNFTVLLHEKPFKGEVRLRSVLSCNMAGMRPIPNCNAFFSSGVSSASFRRATTSSNIWER